LLSVIAWTTGSAAEERGAQLEEPGGAPAPIDQAPAAEVAPLWRPLLLGAQYTGIRQHLFPFSAPYTGPLSLRAEGDTQTTHTFGVYGGVQLWTHLQAYLDVEMFKGAGISNATGLGGLTDGDVVRQGSFNLGKKPYLARLYLRYTVPIGSGSDNVARAMDQLPGLEPSSRLELKVGRLAANDDFDRNRYANSTRTQFENWSLWNNTAWDYAADTRGYTGGLMLGYVTPRWSIKFGVYRMPEVANGPDLVSSLRAARGQNLEATLQPNQIGTIVRLLAYRNVASMGVYRNAIARGIAQGTVPDITADDRPGRTKTGFGVNVEQPLADDGETGLFLRLGWNDGKTETFAFTEVDRHLSFGVQLTGSRWARPEDRLGVALAIDGLSPDHRDYLAAGGAGFVLGDGALNYGLEKIVEVYYRIQIGRFVQLTPDFQYIRNPGYNRDRGPASVIGLRLHLEY
jgi:high affinity Mn2+ porin